MRYVLIVDIIPCLSMTLGRPSTFSGLSKYRKPPQSARLVNGETFNFFQEAHSSRTEGTAIVEGISITSK
jgi:hypothetical protein